MYCLLLRVWSPVSRACCIMWLVRKTLAIVLLSIVVGLTACNRGHRPVASTGELTADEYNVLSAYIAGKLNGKDKERVSQEPPKLIFFSMTKSGDDDLLRDENGRPIPWEKTADSLHTKAPALQQTTVTSFRKANSQQAFLRRSFGSPIEYELVDSNQLESIFKKGDWPAFYNQYSGASGILTWSRVGFSADGTQALFYVSHRCGGLCGGGRYILMVKQASRWVIGTEIVVWVS